MEPHFKKPLLKIHLKRKIPATGTLILLPLIFIPLLFQGCSSSPHQNPKAKQIPDSVIRGFYMKELYGKDKRWELKAEKAEIYGENLIKFYNTTLIFYTKDSDVIVKSSEGEIELKSKRITIRGNVTLKTPEGAYLETDSLTWNPSTKLIETDSFVKIVQKRRVITGYGLEADPQLGEFKIKKKVQIRGA